jgi:hypothetical protein
MRWGKVTYHLKLNRKHTEVEKLYCWPHHEVGLQGRYVHIPQLMSNSASSTSLRNSHDGKEERNS